MNNPGVSTAQLYKFFVKLDFRDKKKAGFRKLIGILVAYFFGNFMLSFGNYNSFDELSYVILSMSTNVFFLAFVILNDFVNLFVGKEEGDVIQALPIKAENIFFSKFFAAYTLIFFYAAAIIIPQIYFYAKYSAEASHIIAFVLCVFLFNVLVISFLVLVYTLIMRYFKKLSHYFVYVVNIAFLVYVFYSTSMKNKAASLGKSSILGLDFVSYLPQTFFAQGINDPLVLVILFASALIMGVLSFHTIKINFAPISAQSSTFYSKEKKSVNKQGVNMLDRIMEKLFLKNNFQKASYFLLKYQLENSKVLKMRYFVFLLMPVVFALIAVFANVPGAVVFETQKIPFAQSSIALISPGILLVFIMCARLIVSNTRIADTNSNDILWMYETMPVKSPGPMRMGVLKFITAYFFIPIGAIMCILLSYRMDLLSAGLNLLYAIASVFFISSIFFSMDKSYPFSLDSSRMDSTGKFLEILLTIVFGAVIFTSMLFVFKNIIFIIISIAVLLLAGSLILKIQRR